MRKMRLLAVAVLVLVFGIGMTAKAASLKEENISLGKEEYRMMEEECMDEVRLILLEKGCKNAGITLTYVTDAEGNRDYIVTVHHAKLHEMDNQELILLQARMTEAAEKMLLTKVTLKQI